MMKINHILAAFVLSTGLQACSSPKPVRSPAAQVTEVALADVPAPVTRLVKAARPDFEMSEVLKKVRAERTYYDVEGTLPGGDEIEFDVLMTPNGPEIVEIQRDIDWADLPADSSALVKAANTEGLDIVRVIESVQTDTSIIYEIFVQGHTSDPRFEVQIKDGNSTLLAERWKH